MLKAWPALIIIPFVLAGCGKPSNPVRTSDKPIPAPHQPLKGDLTTNVQALVEHKYADACDTKQKAMRLEIAQALDGKKEEIQKFLNQPASQTSEYYRSVKVGPIQVREQIKAFPLDPSQESEKSWAEMNELFQKLKDKPVNSGWASLNMQVRGIISDDESRIQYGVNQYLDRGSIKLLPEVKSEIDACVADEKCLSPKVSEKVFNLLRTNLFYLYYMNKLEAELDPAKKRELITTLAKEIKRDAFQHEFEFNKSVVRTTENEITLPLDGTVFEGFEAQIAGYIESVWKLDSIGVKIRWGKKSETPEIFTMFASPTAGGRAFVSFKEKSVNLFSEVRAKSIAHEIGHVLGFTDHYYTIWQPESCSYRIQYDGKDLMADSDTGNVTDEEWTKLRTTYPVSAPAPVLAVTTP